MMVCAKCGSFSTTAPCVRCGNDLLIQKDEVFVIAAKREGGYRIYGKPFTSKEELDKFDQLYMVSGLYIVHCFTEDLQSSDEFMPLHMYLIDMFGQYHPLIKWGKINFLPPGKVF